MRQKSDRSGTPRADALVSRERILRAAEPLLSEGNASMDQVAAAAGVGRSTLYRHFPTRAALATAVAERATDGADDGTAAGVAPIPLLAPAPPLEVTRILEDVPAHLIADQLVAEARRVAGAAVGLYVVDIDGSALVRLAGSEDLPERLNRPPALGPEIVPEGVPGFAARLARTLPRCTVTPLWLRGRVLGLLLCVGAPRAPLDDIAKQGAAALELANDYTDLIESARRRKPTTAAAEVQHHLLPPRIARIAGGQLAGGLLPSYEVGGDWFDFVENRDGAWLAIASASGNGATAAGLSAAALGALRAARRGGRDLVDAVLAIDDVVRGLGDPRFRVTAILARWHAPTAQLAFVNCGHPPARVVSRAGVLSTLAGPRHPPLGSDKRPPTIRVERARLSRGERLVLLTDGVSVRTTRSGGRFGARGLRRAIASASPPTAAGTAMAIQHAVAESSPERLAQDATFVVLAVD